MLKFTLLWLLVFFLSLSSSSARPAPFALRISCGAHQNVHTPPTYTLWYKDFAYTGGTSANATRPSYVTPPLKTLRYFPLYTGPENCYTINGVPKGRYSVRIFFGLVAQPQYDNEPLFDVSVEGTLIHSLKSGWTSRDDQVFAEALVFLLDGTVSICFHSTGHGDPSIIAIEILQVDEKAYGPESGKGVILKATSRLTFGTARPRFDADYGGDQWGGDRYWRPIRTFGQNADVPRITDKSIKQTSNEPNFYPEILYQSAIVGTNSQLDLAYTMDVEPNKNYSIWFHFAEIEASITGAGQRVFDILINGDTVIPNIDVLERTGNHYTALVLNSTVPISGKTMTITFRAKKGRPIINAIEVFQIIAAESKTLPEEVSALQALKKALGLPNRFGWNGDPCVPKEHPWSGAECHFDKSASKWFIDGLGLDNQGLRGFLPDEISNLHHLQSLNLSGNSIHGSIPSSLGNVTSLEVLDMSYNSLDGSIPESLGQLTALRRLNINGNSLSGRVPAALGGRLLNGASFNFTDNAGLCGIPGLPTCGPHLSAGAKVGIGFAASLLSLLLVICSVCWWKRRQNILRAQQIAARGAPYAKARTHLSHDIHLSRHHNHNHNHARTAAENGPSLLS